jgi:hypothetical protein
MLTQLEVERMNFNTQCPRCNQHSIREFKPKDENMGDIR